MKRQFILKVILGAVIAFVGCFVITKAPSSLLSGDESKPYNFVRYL